MVAAPCQKSQREEELNDDLLSEGVEAIITDHGGNARAALRSLLEMVSYLEKARDRALVLVSYGHGRSRVR